ncbi:SGNH hydrolase [Lophiostoma macrostomum CBS 122681]|uniref:SGNH hydrolase n=1 Tax=Lophiostoma macrostomum CBS 122681 TaxID=1314788 RepID=A0A6A6TFF9_9PLEO|nr:SGNH hydrolase [Lophiostoma macrostomum CBS 122681]
MASSKKLPQIVLFGDSLTQWSFNEETRGFGWVLEEKYKGKAEIVNEGQAGYTSTMLKTDFRNIIARASLPGAAPTPLLTIFLGANDACLIPNQGEYVPLPTFEANIRDFVDQVLRNDKMATTKIVLIAPPPINIPQPLPMGLDDAPVDPKKDRGYLTYMSKKKYAEKIMEIAASLEGTGRVIGLDLWKALIDAALEDQNRLGDEDAYDELRLPGAGLDWAEEFKPGYFTDGLHFDKLAYDVLSKSLLEATLSRWPELGPEHIAQ